MKKSRNILYSILSVNIIMFIILIILPNIMIEHIKIIEPLKLIFAIFAFFLPSYTAAILDCFSKKRTKNMKIIMSLFNIALFVSSVIIAFILNLSNVIISETTNISDYLVVDKYVEKLYSKELFPEKIYNNAMEIKYFYRYRSGLDSNYDIFLQYKLSEEDYNKEKNRIINLKLNIINSTIYNGFIDYRMYYNNTSYAFVSFSDETLTIKYIDSYDVNFNEDKLPHFLENIPKQ